MGKELPKVPGGSNVVLYPASVRAGTDLQNSLTESGFTVQRLHTYDTVSACLLPGGCLVHCAPTRGAEDSVTSTCLVLSCPWGPICWVLYACFGLCCRHTLEVHSCVTASICIVRDMMGRA